MTQIYMLGMEQQVPLMELPEDVKWVVIYRALIFDMSFWYSVEEPNVVFGTLVTFGSPDETYRIPFDKFDSGIDSLPLELYSKVRRLIDDEIKQSSPS